MAITTYTELKTEIANWLNKTNLTNEIPDFIRLAESFISNEVFPLGTEAREYASTVAGTSYVKLPTDSMGIKSAHISGSPVQVLEQVALTKLLSSSLFATQGKPKIFSISDGSLVLAPVPDSAYELQVTHQKFENLSDSNDSNPVLLKYPDLYLSASLVWGYRFIKDPKKVAFWTAARNNIASSITIGNQKLTYGSSPIRSIPQVII